MCMEASPLSANQRVLIVDQSPESREVLRTALERQGTEILEACRPRQGLEMVRTHQPDVIVLDLEDRDDPRGGVAGRIRRPWSAPARRRSSCSAPRAAQRRCVTASLSPSPIITGR